MALAASLWFSGFHHGEEMTGVATGTGTPASVEIGTPHSHIGPCCRVQFAILHCENCPVAVKTAGDPFIVTVHALIEPGINLPDDL